MSDDMSAYKDVFLSESAEYVQAIIEGMLALESGPDDSAHVEAVFRAAHSLKGMANAMGYERTAELTHRMEGVMDTVRRGDRAVDRPLVDLMLRAADAAKALIEQESSGSSPIDVGDVVEALIEQGSVVAAEAAGTDGRSEAELEPGESLFRVKIVLEPECVLKSVRAYMALKRLSHMSTVVETIPSAREIEDERFDRSFEAIVRTRESVDAIAKALRVISEVEDVIVVEVEERRRRRRLETEGERRSVPKLTDTQTVRVSIAHLDSLVNLVGELVILRSRLEKLAQDRGSVEILETLEELHRTSAELQHEVMQTRMVPLGNIFNRFPRMMRDLARDLGKDVSFDVEGLDIELDRTVLDEIGDPIVHLLRNSVDHGIEDPEEREAQGKPKRGRVRLAAARDRDQVQITVSDDGRGIDLEQMWEKACECGVVDGSQRESYSDEDVLLLTCTPGFSTAEHATKVSGRGVGMDVVRGKIEYLGGSLFIQSEPGKGSAFILTLPLTLAIIQALLVAVGDQAYAVPLGAVSEVLSPEEVSLESVDGNPVIVLRDREVVPVQRLRTLLSSPEDGSRALPEAEHLVLIGSGEQTRALAVDRLVGRQEIVIKPLSPMFRHLRGLGGATVLGDGSVALILDPRSLFSMGEEA